MAHNGQRIHDELKYHSSSFENYFLVICRMARGNAARAKVAVRGGRVGARSDVEEAYRDSQAEINDMSAALNTSDKPAVESAGEVRPHLPDGLLQRRIEKARNEKEQVIEEKELLQKQLDDMRAERQLEQANNAKVGDVVDVVDSSTRYARNYFEYSL
jgi:hypothetical protein